MDIRLFRQAIISAVQSAKAASGQIQLHLLYLPELADPLALIDDGRRSTQLIHPPAGKGVIAPDKESLPRLVTLDCRRVAAYLLETDPALDDPLFEASITQAHAEIHLKQKYDAELANSTREFSEYAIGGWIFGEEAPHAIATRLRSLSNLWPFNQQLRPLRWTSPGYLGALWPTLTPEQRHALLGTSTWLAFDATGQLRRYAADGLPPVAHEGAQEIGLQARHLDSEQSHIIQNLALVRDLLPTWQALCEELSLCLPDDAERQLHSHAGMAQRLGLDADSVAIYAAHAMMLRPGATEDAEWLQLMRHTAHHGLLLLDTLAQLPQDFWARWRLDARPAQYAPAQYAPTNSPTKSRSAFPQS